MSFYWYCKLWPCHISWGILLLPYWIYYQWKLLGKPHCLFQFLLCFHFHLFIPFLFHSCHFSPLDVLGMIGNIFCVVSTYRNYLTKRYWEYATSLPTSQLPTLLCQEPPPPKKIQEIRRSGKFKTFAYIYVSLRWYSRLWLFVLKNNCMFHAALFLGEGALVVEQRVGFIYVFV